MENGHSSPNLQIVARKQPDPTGPLASRAVDDFLAHGGSLERLRVAWNCKRTVALDLVLTGLARRQRELELRQSLRRAA